jgi:aspartokinase/homoserine dehydrogenase 1
MTLALRHAPAPTTAHARAATRVTRIDVVLIGPRGQVGTALRTLLAAQAPRLRAQSGIDLHLLAAADRHGLAFDLHGLDPLDLHFDHHPQHTATLDRVLNHLGHPGQPPCIVIDCTASAEVAARYAGWLSAGVGVVTPNKLANAGPLARYRELQDAARRGGAPWRYETTVGAAIPVLGPLADIRQRGEPVRRLRGVLSGSLSFLLDRLHAGQSFDHALREAQSRGYTEPDPDEDLQARDLARKLVILAREAGFDVEPEAVQVQPFVTSRASGNAEWAQRLATTPTDQRWVVLAEADANGARVHLATVSNDSPFAALRAGENRLCVETEWQSDKPLWLGGAGAGPQITAAGVFSDVVAAARQLAWRR